MVPIERGYEYLPRAPALDASVGYHTERGTLCPPTSTFVSRKPTGAAAMAAPSNPGEVALASALPGKEDCEKNAAAVTPAIASLRPMVRVPALEHRTPSAPTTPLRPGRVLAAAATAPPIEDQARDWCGSRARKSRACRDGWPLANMLAARG